MNKVIAPGFARSNNLQTKFKLNTKFSLYSLHCTNANIGKPRLNERKGNAFTLPSGSGFVKTKLCCVSYRVTTLQERNNLFVFLFLPFCCVEGICKEQPPQHNEMLKRL